MDAKDTIDYAAVYSLIRDVVEGKAFGLVEALACELAGLLLDKFPVYRVTLRVRKLHPPVAGLMRHIEVEVTRYQGDTSKIVNPGSSKDK